MAITYTRRLLIERIRRHFANDFPSDEFVPTELETNLYIDSAIASTVVGAMLGGAKITKEMATPEALIVTTQLAPLLKNDISNEWYTTLPQTPLSLSIGYSIPNLYFGDPSLGTSQTIWLIKSKRAAFRPYMPYPTGTSATVRGNLLYIKANDGTSLSQLVVYVDMVKTRSTDMNEIMPLPDDMLDIVFDKVIAKCKDRLQIPSDIIKDNLSVGASNVSKV